MTANGPASAPFSALLRRLRIERGLSQAALSRLAAADPSYVNRLERTGPENGSGPAIGRTLPSRAVVLALAEALELSAASRDRLLYAAGLAPEVDWQARCEDAEARLALVRDALGTPSEPRSEAPVASVARDATILVVDGRR